MASQLVDEDDGRSVLAGLLEEVAHARRADADDHLHELRRAHGEEGHAGLARHRAREAASSPSGRADQQHSLGSSAPRRVYFAGSRRKSTISVSSCLASSIPATSSKVTFRVRRQVVATRLALAEAHQAADPPPLWTLRRNIHT